MPALTRSDNEDLPTGLRPYKFHGLDLAYRKGERNATAMCPFCGKEGKFSIEASTSKWRCFACNEGFDKADKNGQSKTVRGGNSLEFLRLLWKYSDDNTRDYSEIVAERDLLGPGILVRWELVKSLLTDEWLMPGYTVEGELTQLYRYVNVKTKDKKTGKDVWKRRLIPTPEMGEPGHRSGIFGMGGFDKKRKIIDLFEGWNGIAFEEVITQVDSDLWAEPRNVIAFPGCAGFDERWVPLFKGKIVNIWYDNDHPRLDERTGKLITGAGWMYSIRAAQMLRGVAEQVNVLQWGDKGHNPELPSGYDVRDAFKGLDSLKSRSEALYGLFPLLKPAGLISQISASDGEVNLGKPGKLQPKPCDNFADLVIAWRKALRWRKELEDALAVCLAINLSTEQVGDQLFLLLVADAGSAKTKFCDGFLVSENCYAVENVNGLHSGWQGGAEFSPIVRMNRKMWVTAEGDTVVNHPAFAQFMAQVRRAFDGKSHASYKNQKEDQSMEGLRLTWVLAGTPAMIDVMNNQANLGDRFLKYFIKQPDDDEKKHILMRSAYSALSAVKQKSGPDAESQTEPEMKEAHQLTGGYCDWLRSHTELLDSIEMSDEYLIKCAELGEFAACFRARPSKSKSDDAQDAKEMPTRLTKQFVRLAVCLAVVHNKDEVDAVIMQQIRKVAIDTSMGLTLKIAKGIYLHWKAQDGDGSMAEALAMLTGKTNEKTRELLKFMKVIGLSRYDRPTDPETGKQMTGRWWLTEKGIELYEGIIVNWEK